MAPIEGAGARRRLVADYRRVYNLGLDEFIAWFAEEPAAGVEGDRHRLAFEARGLGPISINVRITAARKLAVEAVDNALLAAKLASGIARVTGVRSHGVRVGNWRQARRERGWAAGDEIGPRT